MDKWRLLDTGARPAHENVALDRIILRRVARGASPNTLRFLSFRPAAVLVGYHQDPRAEARSDYCKAHGIEVNRRLTGGGAIYMGEGQLGWELIAKKEDLSIGSSPQAFFERVGAAVARSLSAFGVEARFRLRNDIEVEGRKIGGTGALEEGGAFLFQGTILLNFEAELMLKALRVPAEKLNAKGIESAKERVASINELTGRCPSLGAVKGAICGGLRAEFGFDFEASGLFAHEESGLGRMAAYFSSENWIYGSGPAFTSKEVLCSRHKSPAGLVNMAASIDLGRSIIEQIIIMGDFFASPRRGLLDLEAALKGAPLCRAEDIIRGHFKRGGFAISGMGPYDLVCALRKLLTKSRLLALGFSCFEANSISTVLRGFEEIDEVSILLLPYCCKMPRCKYRLRKECPECAGCEAGGLYALGRRAGLAVETILNFEDLMSTLRKGKVQGAKSFIGSCCKPFLTNHLVDFEAAGLPGIIVDIDDESCYELGRARDALTGDFSGQVRLRRHIIEKIISMKRASR